MLLFLVLEVNSDWFQSYTFLLKPPVLEMCDYGLFSFFLALREKLFMQLCVRYDCFSILLFISVYFYVIDRK